MIKRAHLIQSEQGIAMVLVVLTGVILTLLSVTLIELVRDDSDRSAQQLREGAAFQAAEAGINDLAAKLVDDRQYFNHYVHPGESTRRDLGTGSTASPGAAWTHGLTWDYPGGADNWRQLTNGYEYNLQIVGPSATAKYIKVTATGRKIGSTTDVRVVESLIRPTSLADYYRVVNGNVGWGAGALTNGKIYANGNISHDGTAAANVYAEGQITGSYTLTNGAQTYDVDSNPNIRSQIKNPLNFSSFLASFVDIEAAAQYAGIFRDDPSKAAWRFTFQSSGNVLVESCVRSGTNHVAEVPPVCTTDGTYPVPANGAIYTAQDALVSGVVDGRVTIASNDNIVVVNDISYEQVGDDVLGLIAKNNLYVAWYVPDPLTWMASVLAQNGTWRSYTGCCSPKKNLMTFTGSSATDDGGSFTAMFTNRTYGYEQSLQYLPPPWFPVIGDAYTVLLFRELPSG